MRRQVVRMRRGRHNPLGEIPQSDYEAQGKELLDPGGGLYSDYFNGDSSVIFPFAVGIVSIQVIPNNPLRIYFLIQNTGLLNIFVNFGQSAGAANSLRLIPGAVYEQIGVGGGRSLDPNKPQFSSGGFITPDSVHVVGAAAGQTGVIIEGIRPAIQGGF